MELNAFDTKDLIEWIESKLKEHGVEKIVADQETLELAYRRYRQVARFEKDAPELRKQLETEWEAKVSPYIAEDPKLKVPKSLDRDVKKYLERNPAETWENAALYIAWTHEEKQRQRQKKAKP